MKFVYKRRKTIKELSLNEYVEERNRVYTHARTRSLSYGETRNYWAYRLREMDKQHPEFRGMGVIKIKGTVK